MTLYFDEATETLPREQLAAVQLKRLQVMLADMMLVPYCAMGSL